MDLKLMKSEFFHESAARRVFFRIFLFASTVSIIPIVQILTTHDFINHRPAKPQLCYSSSNRGISNPPRGSYLFQGHFLNPVWDSFESTHCHENVNLTISLIKDLVDSKHLFNRSAKVLYIGGSSSSAVSALTDLGFSDAVGVNHGRLLSIDYANCSFDFVLYRGRLKVLVVPDFVVVEVERVLKYGGVGAVVLGKSVRSDGGGGGGGGGRIVKLLKSSCVVDLGYVNKFYMTVFKKKSGNDGGSDDQFPVDCSAFTGNITL